MDGALKYELGDICVSVPRFYATFFEGVADLETASKAIFKKCTEGTSPLFFDEWTGWPQDANETDVLSWFSKFTKKLAAFADEYKPNPTSQRRLLVQPNKPIPIPGSTAERKLDVSFVNNPEDREYSTCYWSQILIPGELKKNPMADIASKAWLDIGTYAREVFAAQDARRFVLSFTLCGSLMRIWEFDRLGGIASERFDINTDGLQFVSTILGFLWMNEAQLGFDPTIKMINNQRFIVIERDGRRERIFIDKVITRVRCVAGRATTSWKAHPEGDPQTPLVIKDSWQNTERDEEGELLYDATGNGVINVARHYHHETVQVCDADDDIRSNVRKGIDITSPKNYEPIRSIPLSEEGKRDASESSRNRNSRKRLLSQTGTSLPANKRSFSQSLSKFGSHATSKRVPNRVHRRVVLRDYGKPIYKASSRAALLTALEGCIEGHKSLYKASFIHRDISVNNLMINEDKVNPSWPSFLIDLDLAIKVQRVGASGAKGITGTRVFMAIGILMGERHSFMHDLESFFWVLFWICIHYDGSGKDVGPSEFESWNCEKDRKLASLKKGEIGHEGDFIENARNNFTTYYQPLVHWVNRLRKVVFPNGRRWEKADAILYSRMQDVLREARMDPNVVGA
ncbi:uncharacterized protein BCR38DRAFT_489030 [Pseudomassariella vexata]|uniref:non-specific serine/threonine protein kinase n=1 Tax=Pseudomassariella vexata TaxID=1141098 RepID=A0A1Y2DJ65_9PEZI|nr:uncharacterized protein BCR38DRAFT_489030 [Pseudomassariella vexata]ORY59298.1 hypothetical protein BCR38DRAFT_489030 [Pseudomassariella vexata]